MTDGYYLEFLMLYVGGGYVGSRICEVICKLAFVRCRSLFIRSFCRRVVCEEIPAKRQPYDIKERN